MHRESIYQWLLQFSAWNHVLMKNCKISGDFFLITICSIYLRIYTCSTDSRTYEEKCAVKNCQNRSLIFGHSVSTSMKFNQHGKCSDVNLGDCQIQLMLLHVHAQAVVPLIAATFLTFICLIICIRYCKSRTFHKQLIFAIFDDEANPWNLKASKYFTVVMIEKRITIE